jgi:hypothetical protein
MQDELSDLSADLPGRGCKTSLRHFPAARLLAGLDSWSLGREKVWRERRGAIHGMRRGGSVQASRWTNAPKMLNVEWPKCSENACFRLGSSSLAPVRITHYRLHNPNPLQISISPSITKVPASSSRPRVANPGSCQGRIHPPRHHITTFISPGAALGATRSAAAFEGRPKIAINAIFTPAC